VCAGLATSSLLGTAACDVRANSTATGSRNVIDYCLGAHEFAMVTELNALFAVQAYIPNNKMASKQKSNAAIGMIFTQSDRNDVHNI
jgi:hypothetical protein